MKKEKNLRCLNLNKKSISNFKIEEIKGGHSTADGCGGQTSDYPHKQ